MYRTGNDYAGEPSMLYRSPAEIKADIRDISIRIKETESLLNIRSLLMDMLTAAESEAPGEWIPEIEEVVNEASATLDELYKLKDSLDELFCEWREVKCVAGI